MNRTQHSLSNIVMYFAIACAGCGQTKVEPLSTATPDPNGPLMPVLGSRSEVETTANARKEVQTRHNAVDK